VALKTNVLYQGDNLDFLREFPDESVELVYLDPPFNSRRDYNVVFGARSEPAFEDTWSWDADAKATYAALLGDARVSGLIGALHTVLGPGDVLAYLVMMTPRLVELHRVLKPTGSIYLHCDPASSHYLKVGMDAVFGAGNFRRELIWRSGWVSGFKAAARNWVRNHDVLLYYAKEWSRATYFDKSAAYKPHPPGYKRRGGGANPRGVAIDDVWDEVELYSPWIKSFSTEKLGYRTQKPLALLRRIVAASCPPGGLVLDPFCGCGTTLSAAHELRRQWIGIDVADVAMALTRARMRDEHGLGDQPGERQPAYVGDRPA
jgi:DNA modification methylase